MRRRRLAAAGGARPDLVQRWRAARVLLLVQRRRGLAVSTLEVIPLLFSQILEICSRGDESEEEEEMESGDEAIR
jgi:hypothetical protein